MGIRDLFNLSKKADATIVSGQEKIDVSESPEQSADMATGERGYVKRFIPYFIYRPPFGYPRRDIDLVNVRKLAKTPFVFSVIKTVLDELCALEWDIVATEGNDEESLKEKKKEIKAFFYNPNDNNESFRELLRGLGRDILELDAGVLEKVYNRGGELTQLFTVDGATILKNPDEHGYMGNRVDYVPVITDEGLTQDQIKWYYSSVLKEQAAYFQYNWTGGIWPVPFGKKELIYISSNTQSDSIYGSSPIMILYNVILTLMYATQVNLDSYVGNNLPTGMLSIINANKEQIKSTREYFNQLIMQTDEFGNNRKKFFNIPITSTDAKYTPFTINAKEMQMLEQQKWYQQLVYKVYGVTPDEMGETSDSNRSTANEQSRIFKRKALKPLLNLIEYNFNTRVMWELDPSKSLEFKFNSYDIEEEFRKAELNEKLLSTWSVNEIRKKDNQEPLDDEKFDTLNSAAFGGGFGNEDEDSNQFGDANKMNTDANKTDMQNNKDSKDEDDKSASANPKKVVDKKALPVKKLTDSEKALQKMYDSLEKTIINSFD